MIKSHRTTGSAIIYLVVGIFGIGLAIFGITWLRSATTLLVVHPVRGPAVQSVYATGTVEATVMMPIAARSTSRLTELLADEGAEVKAGDVLAQLEDEDLQKGIEELIVRESLAKRSYERGAQTLKGGAMSEDALDRAKTEWEATKAALARANVAARYLKLIAPSAGRIIRRDGEVGQMIAANQIVFWIAVDSPLRISSEVDEEDIALVEVGQKVLIRADAFPGAVFHGKVQSITEKGDPVGRSYRVRIGLTEETTLRIGMTTETNIIVSEDSNALLVPASAVSKDKVWLVTDGKLSLRTVAIGARGVEQLEVRSGITEQDSVVKIFGNDLIEGKSVSSKLVK